MKFRNCKIQNKTRNTLVAGKTAVADTFFRRLKGLLGESSLPEGAALVIKPCSAIHTFGMRFAIDVIFLDRNNRVVKTCAAVKPNKVFIGSRNAAVAIELPVGSIERAGVSVGDRLSVEGGDHVP